MKLFLNLIYLIINNKYNNKIFYHNINLNLNFLTNFFSIQIIIIKNEFCLNS